MNVKNNRRRKTSQEKIEKAFVELLEQNRLSEITVSQVVKKAGLNRSTFYANYFDIFDLADTIRVKLEKSVAKLFAPDLESGPCAKDYLKLFSHIKENQIFYKTYFKLGYDGEHKINLCEVVGAERLFEGRQLEYRIEFFKAGFNAMIKKWLEDGCPESPEDMGEILKIEYQNREIT